MRIIAIGRRESDYGRELEEWMRDFELQTGREIEMIDPDSREGAGMAGVYDVVEYPTIMAIREDGSVAESWRGKMLPKIDQVAYWA